MIGPQTGRRLMSRLAGAVTVAALSTGAVASAASAASLKVTVPSQVKNGTPYGIQVQGSYKPKELTGRAYVITLIQFNGRPCRATAQAENLWAIHSHATVDFYLRTKAHPQRVGIFTARSPFSFQDGFRARSLGTRHVCAYLYPKFIHAGDVTAPIARADKRLKVTR